MKIIFAPSKSKEMTAYDNQTATKILFPQKSKEILKRMKLLSKKELATILSIKNNILDQTYSQYQDSVYGTALTSFIGTSFKELSVEGYSKEEREYLRDNLRILSAVYGIIQPFDSIAAHRLDMNDKIFYKDDEYKNLYEYWQNEVSNYFSSEKNILNLASSEYAKMLGDNPNIINVDFYILKNKKLKSISVYAKQERGKMLDFCIKNKLTQPEHVKKYTSDFIFSEQESDSHNYVFIKK
ncbi:MAG: YaaA family protein [Candidatus Pacebacteria bacterium]|nr:YaaA family protein [Candidatus Paceibacterota bacterium]